MITPIPAANGNTATSAPQITAVKRTKNDRLSAPSSEA
jgi:hypothetical protein